MTLSTATSPDLTAANSVCAACGAAFRCGMVGADATCWCYDLPHVMAVPTVDADAASCLCPTCLDQKLERKHHGNQS